MRDGSLKTAGLAIGLLLLAAVLFVRGCRSQEPQNWVNTPPSEESIQKRITQIQNDPHMPQFAKDAAIGQLKAHMQGAHP
jgi:hypothetical protein